MNILASFLIGGLSWLGSRDAAGLTKILVPEMEKRGYHKEFSCAVTANAAVIDNLIPPAATMMIYGAVASVSVPRIFLAGIVPGMVLTLGLMVAAQIMSIRRGTRGLEHRATGREMVHSLKGAGWAIPMPFMILGGMRAGRRDAHGSRWRSRRLRFSWSEPLSTKNSRCEIFRRSCCRPGWKPAW